MQNLSKKQTNAWIKSQHNKQTINKQLQIGCIMKRYGNCPKTVYTTVSDNMANANNIDPDQTAPEVF